MVGVFGDEHMGDGRLGRQAALDQPRRCRRLDDDVLASAAGVFGPAHHNHSELRGNDVEPFTDVLADPVQCAFAGGAGPILDVDDRLDARQMRWQGAAVGAPLAGSFRARRRRLRFGRLGLALLDVFERQQQLVFRQALGASAKAVALQVPDDRDKPLRSQALGDQHRLQRLRVVGKRLGGLRHDSDKTMIRRALRRFSSP
jgi:hypothetical protein